MSAIDFHDLAKAELHCHLDGSLSIPVIRKLAKMADVTLPESDADLKERITAPKDATSLVDYLKTFDFVRPLLQTKEALRLAAYDVARQAASENVLYIEVRFAPELSMDEGLTAKETIEGVVAGLKDAQEEFGIVAKCLACGMRQSSVTLTEALFGKIAELAADGFVGFDFAGDEHGFPPEKIKELIAYTQSLGYPMTFHAGECGCPNHITYSISLGIKRMGHVTAICQEAEILEAFVEAGVTAELCLTSNLQTKAAQTIADFPYLDLVKAGAKLSINTDNRTVSDTTLAKEYQLFHDYFGTKPADFFTYNQMALDAAFINQDQKEVLKAKLLENPHLSSQVNKFIDN